MATSDIGLVGLAVMGQNLVLNMADHGFTVSVFNRTVSKVTEFVESTAKGKSVVGTTTIKDFIASLKRPRRIMLMVKAGKAVDDFIDMCLPHLEQGDIIIDGGNSHWDDSNRRSVYLKEKGIHYIGSGISGGEEGARNGPSIMPGGHKEAWPHVKEIFQSICAKVNNEACCDWVGEDGAGHYVKMVHNGIEYGDMQIICEAYYLMKEALGLSNTEFSEIFSKWNAGELESYLIEITAQIFQQVDAGGTPVVDTILDVAGQKGTGKWTAINSLDMGIPLTLIGEAVNARYLSSLKNERVEASQKLQGPEKLQVPNKDEFIEAIGKALYASKIISYAQGFMLMREAARQEEWHLNFGSIALMWRGGCIIRSRFLGKIKEAFDKNPNLKSLLLDDFFAQEFMRCQDGLRKVVSWASQLGITAPCFASALSFYDGYRSSRLPANLLQAQRDFFGAHTYERIDKPRGEFFHTQWQN